MWFTYDYLVDFSNSLQTKPNWASSNVINKQQVFRSTEPLNVADSSNGFVVGTSLAAIKGTTYVRSSLHLVLEVEARKKTRWMWSWDERKGQGTWSRKTSCMSPPWPLTVSRPTACPREAAYWPYTWGSSRSYRSWRNIWQKPRELDA